MESTGKSVDNISNHGILRKLNYQVYLIPETMDQKKRKEYGIRKNRETELGQGVCVPPACVGLGGRHGRRTKMQGVTRNPIQGCCKFRLGSNRDQYFFMFACES